MNYTTTTNGAITNQTSGKECLDLFQRIGNMRHHDRLHILEEFQTAFKDDKDNYLFDSQTEYENSRKKSSKPSCLDDAAYLSTARRSAKMLASVLVRRPNPTGCAA